jgi:hypothetical protein
MLNVACPVSSVQIDRNVVRTAGLLSSVGLAAYVMTGSALFIVPIALDYVVRAMGDGMASPLTIAARRLAAALALPYRPTDQAPSAFASRIGVWLAVGAALAHFVVPAAALWLAGTLAFVAGLESVLDFCAAYVALPTRLSHEAAGRASRIEA